MADFKCEDGKFLSNEETADMLAYDEARLPRPERYNDVVFDNTSGVNAGYRCKTAEEKRLGEEAAARARADSDAAIERRNRVMKEAGVDPALLSTTARPASFNLAAPDAPAIGATGTKSDTEAKSDTKDGK